MSFWTLWHVDYDRRLWLWKKTMSMTMTEEEHDELLTQPLLVKSSLIRLNLSYKYVEQGNSEWVYREHFYESESLCK